MPGRYTNAGPFSLDANSLNTVTAAVQLISGTSKMTFYRVPATGTQLSSVVTPQVSPDGTSWFDVPAARMSTAAGMVMVHECSCHSVRFKVTTAEGGVSTCDLYVFAV